MAPRSILTAVSVLSLALALTYMLKGTLRSSGTLNAGHFHTFRYDTDCDVGFTRPDMFNASQPQLEKLEISAMELPRIFELVEPACVGVLAGHSDITFHEYRNHDTLKDTLQALYVSAAHDLPTALTAQNCDAAKDVVWSMGMALSQITQELWLQPTSLWHDTDTHTLESLVLNAVYCSRWSALSYFLVDIWTSFLALNMTFQHTGIDEELTVIGKADACEMTVARAVGRRYCWRKNMLGISSSVRNANEHLVHFWDHNRTATDPCSNRFLGMVEELCVSILVDFHVDTKEATQRCSPNTPGSQE